MPAQLVGHLGVGADERERRPGDVVGRRSRNAVGDLSGNGGPVLGDGHDLHERFDDGCPAGPLGLLADRPELAVQLCRGPSGLMMVTVGQRPAQAGQADDVGVASRRPQHPGVPAPDREPDALTGRQVLKPGAPQCQVPALVRYGLAAQQPGDNVNELGQPLGALPGRRPQLPDILHSRGV